MMRSRVLLGLAATALLLAACGGDSDDGSGGDTSGGETSSTIDLEASEFKYELDLWRVQSGASVVVAMDNVGTVEHNWVLLEQGVDANTSAGVQADDIIFELNAQPGQTQQGTFTAPGAGTYRVVCTIPGHLEAGMEGSLRVE